MGKPSKNRSVTSICDVIYMQAVGERNKSLSSVRKIPLSSWMQKLAPTEIDFRFYTFGLDDPDLWGKFKAPRFLYLF